MEDYNQSLKEEETYLGSSLGFIRSELDRELHKLSDRRGELVKIRKEMWENTVHFSADFERLTEITQYLSVLENQTSGYGGALKQVKKYERMLKEPYFGRFDFIEEGEEEREKIYIGLHNVMDNESCSIIIYDWRAPIAGIFYEYELGEAQYRGPGGSLKGSVLLKRQYKITEGRLKYFFDCSVQIDDEVLQQMLSRNASAKMRNIVETIQKEQNAIIRDSESDLLIVQGTAGSGKTSIALHRIAFLLYQGMNSKLTSNNIMLISPNDIFSRYISSVLPELGEENVRQVTFDEIFTKLFGKGLKAEKRYEVLEHLISCRNREEAERRLNCAQYKGSSEFTELLKRWLRYYERHLVCFEDIYYDGKLHFLTNSLIHSSKACVLKDMDQNLWLSARPTLRKWIRE